VAQPDTCPNLGHIDPGYAAIDPMALVLHGDAYLSWVEIHHPRDMGLEGGEVRISDLANYAMNIAISKMPVVIF
jgi:hypothetical protein